MRTLQDPTHPELLALLGSADLSGYQVTYLGIREARAAGKIVDGPFRFTTDDQFDRLWHRLAAITGSETNNHQTYLVVTPSGQTLYFWFRDWHFSVSTAIEPY